MRGIKNYWEIIFGIKEHDLFELTPILPKGLVRGFKRRGPMFNREYVSLCPFYREKTPSFYWVPQKGFFRCFGCGRTYDAISFFAAINEINYLEAVVRLARFFKIKMEWGEVDSKIFLSPLSLLSSWDDEDEIPF